MCAIITYVLTCPKCEKEFSWCNGGDVIVSRSQLIATCPHCHYESFPRDFKSRPLKTNDIFITHTKNKH